METIMALLKELVEHDSSTQEGANKLLKKVVRKYLKPKGYSLDRFSFNGSDSVYASLNNNYAPKILFLGHLDTVDALGWKNHNPFRMAIETEKAYGLGILDMKAGIAVLFDLALNKPNPDIAYLFVTDEERGGFNGAGKIVNLDSPKIKPAFVIAAEPSQMSIELCAKGVLNLKVVSKGISAHSSKPEEGVNAIEQLHRYIDEVRGLPLFRKKNKLLGKTTIVMTVISCPNQRENQIPDHCECVVNLRYIPEVNKDKILDAFQKTARKYGGENSGVTVAVQAYAVPVSCDPKEPFVVRLAEAIEEETGSVNCIGNPAASDARFFAEKGIPCLCFGPIGEGMHAPEEWLDLEKFGQYVKILERFVERAA